MSFDPDSPDIPEEAWGEIQERDWLGQMNFLIEEKKTQCDDVSLALEQYNAVIKSSDAASGAASAASSAASKKRQKTTSGKYFRYASESDRRDKDAQLRAVIKNGMNLEHCLSPSPEVVKAALKQNPNAAEFAPDAQEYVDMFMDSNTGSASAMRWVTLPDERSYADKWNLHWCWADNWLEKCPAEKLQTLNEKKYLKKIFLQRPIGAAGYRDFFYDATGTFKLQKKLRSDADRNSRPAWKYLPHVWYKNCIEKKK